MRLSCNWCACYFLARWGLVPLAEEDDPVKTLSDLLRLGLSLSKAISQHALPLLGSYHKSFGYTSP